MATYVFALPIAENKVELMKKYSHEMTGPRGDEFHRRNQEIGLKIVQVWIQNTPTGKLALIRWETDDPKRVIEHMKNSDDPFENWFREKIIIEVFGRDPYTQTQPINEQIVDYQGQPTKTSAYAEAKNR